MEYNCLTDDQKAELILLYGTFGSQRTFLSRVSGVNKSTIRSFINRYLEDGILTPKRGAPKKITSSLEKSIIEQFEDNPETTLKAASVQFDISGSAIKKVLNDDGIEYFSKIAIPNLTDEHKQKRVAFSQKICNYEHNNLPNIIIIDESTVEVNLKKGGIWRRRGHYPNGTFYTKEGHPISVMVWGGIGPNGYKTKLLRINGKMNSEKYVDLLLTNDIFLDIQRHFGQNYIFQQDNAPPHKSKYTMGILNDITPELLDWPAKSPDLSPIEQLWNYLKRKLAGVNFNSKDELFERLSKEWDDIPAEIIKNHYTSFQARCTVCINNNGNNLNGHWKEVKKVHDSYRH